MGRDRTFDYDFARRLRRDGWSMRQIADFFEMSVPAVKRVCCNIRASGYDRCHRHDPEVIAAVVAAYGLKSASILAEEHGFPSRNVVVGIWNRHRR